MRARVLEIPSAVTLGHLAALLSAVPLGRGALTLRLAPGSSFGCSTATALVSWARAHRDAGGTLDVDADPATWAHLHRSRLADLLGLTSPVAGLPSPVGAAELHVFALERDSDGRQLHKFMSTWLRERCRVAEEWVEISDGVLETLTDLPTPPTQPTIVGLAFEPGRLYVSVAQSGGRPLALPKGPAISRHFDRQSLTQLYRPTDMGRGLDPALSLAYGVTRVNRGILRVRTGARLWQHGPEGEGATPVARLPGLGVDLEFDVTRRVSLYAAELDDEDGFDGDDPELDWPPHGTPHVATPRAHASAGAPAVIPLRPRADTEWLLTWRTTDRFRVVFDAPDAVSARAFAERVLEASLDADLDSDNPTGLDGEQRSAYSYHVDLDGQSLTVDVEVSAEFVDNSMRLRPMQRPARLMEATLVPTLEITVDDVLIDIYDHVVLAHALGISESELRGHVTRKRCLPRSQLQDARPSRGHDLYTADQVDAVLAVYEEMGGPRAAAAQPERTRAAIAARWGALARAPRKKPIPVCAAPAEIDPTLVGTGKWVATWSESDEYRAVVRAVDQAEAIECANVLRGFVHERVFVNERPWDIEEPGRVVCDGVVFDVAPSWQVTDFDSTVRIVPVEGLRAVAPSTGTTSSRMGKSPRERQE